MTWRAIWGEPFPEWSDHATEADAHREALRVSREEGVEVAVIAVPGPESGLGATNGVGRVRADVPGAGRGGE